jgi:peptidoglycan/xylan/chitin deacetylase (PgdA/CDA1 family)
MIKNSYLVWLGSMAVIGRMTQSQYEKLKCSKLITIVLTLLMLLSLFVSLATIQAVSATRGVVSITFDDGFQTQYDYAFPILQASGIKATFYVITARINTSSYMTFAELVTLQNNGHEIGSHTDHHYDLPDIPEWQMRQELQVSQQTLRSWGLSANNFAYPDFLRTAYTDLVVHDYYRSSRGGQVPPFIIQLPTSLFLLPAQQGDYGNSKDLPTIKALVDDAYNSNGWVIIAFHNVIPNGGTSQNTISSASFTSFLDYIKNRGVATLTVDQALKLASSPSPTATPSPSPTATPSPSPTATPSPSPTATPSPSPTATPSLTPSPTVEPTPILSPMPTQLENPDPILTETPPITNTQTSLTTPSPTVLASPMPSPPPSSVETVAATSENGEIVILTQLRNVTGSKMSDATIVFNPSTFTTTLSFTITGPSGTTGFGNITIPKSAVTYGTKPIIYFDGQPAHNQGCTQDAINYYVWYTTHFSIREVSIVFTLPPNSTQLPSQSQSSPQGIICEATFVVFVVVVIAAMLVIGKSKKEKRCALVCF